MSIVNHTAALRAGSFAHTRAEAVALSAGGVCPAGNAVKPHPGVGISRGDPAPQ